MKPAVFSKNQGSLKLRPVLNNPTEWNQLHSQNQNLQASLFFPVSNLTLPSGFLTKSTITATIATSKAPSLFQTNTNTNAGENNMHTHFRFGICYDYSNLGLKIPKNLPQNTWYYLYQNIMIPSAGLRLN
jgi:hypothetical protein